MNICAYHGNLYLPEFKEHLYEMRMKGFDTILFAISETDATYNRIIFEEFREYTEACGMTAACCFWGYSAGEAIVSNMTVIEWMDKIVAMGFKNVLIDEPRSEFQWKQFETLSPEVHLSCVVPDDVFDKLTDDEIKNFPVDNFGFSNYHTIFDYIEILERSEERCRRLKRLRPDDGFVFIQGFDLTYKTRLLPMLLRDQCFLLGIKNFGFWSFRCTQVTGTKRSFDWEWIWKTIEF